MIKKIGFVLAYLITTSLCAQDGSVSPYSYFGLGDIREAGTVENQMMGDIGVYVDSIHINFKNPAALSKLGVRGRDDFGITTYTVGLSHEQLRFKSFAEQQNTSVTNLDYLALALSLKEGLGVSFGIRPYSSVNYNFQDLSGEEGSRVLNQFSGDGGLNKVFASLGYELAKELSIGVTVNYNFGTIDSEIVQSSESVQFGARDSRSSRIGGFDLNYALNYTPAIDKNHSLYTSLRVNTQANLSSRNTRQLSSFLLSTTQDVEVIELDLEAQGLRQTGVKIPTTATFGLGYGQNFKWFLGAEYSYQQLGDFENEFLAFDNIVYEDASTFSLGGFFIPDRGSFESYLKRVTYRAGIRYSRTGMVINDKDINNLGITFGLGLPLGGSFSNLNLGFELGRRGTSAADLIEESYFKFNVGLSLSDQWFRKRMIN